MLTEKQAQNIVNAYKNKDFFAKFVEDKRCVDVLYHFIFHPNSSIMIYADKLSEANMILEAHRNTLTTLPEEFQPRIRVNNRGTLEADLGGFGGSIIRTVSSVNNMRGLTINFILISNSISRRDFEEFQCTILPILAVTNERFARWEN